MLNYEEHIAPYLIPYGDSLPKEKKLLHPYYEESVARKKLLSEVFGDEYPSFLKVERPKEKTKTSHEKFREVIYKAVTKPVRRRIINAIAAIRNADDWSVEFPPMDEGVPYEDTLRYYVTEDFGPWRSFDAWFWKQGVQRYVDDPNGCAILLPEPSEKQTQYQRVLPIWATSAQVWYYEEGGRAVIRAEKTSTVLHKNGKTTDDGLILYFFDKDTYCTARQVEVIPGAKANQTRWEVLGLDETPTEDGQTILTANFPKHYYRSMPCFRLGNLMEKTSEDGRFVLYESLVSVAVPHLKSVLQRASDIEIEALLHTGSLEWVYVSSQCKTCSGTGSITTYAEESGTDVKKCHVCGGAGFAIADTNMERMLITPPKQTEFDDDNKPVSLPTPPGGFIERSADAIIQFREELERNLKAAYSAMGFAHIANQLFMSTSGTSKRYDREEAEKVLVDTAKHFTEELIIPAFAAIDAIRYGPAGKATLQLPVVKSPKRFDISTNSETREELIEAMNGKFSQEIIDALQLKRLEQIAGKDSIFYRSYRVKMLLNPFRNLGDESLQFAKDALFLKGDRTKGEFNAKLQEYDFSLDFDLLIRNLLLVNPEFYDLELQEQKTLLDAEAVKYFSVRPAGLQMEFSQLTPLTDVNDIDQNIGG